MKKILITGGAGFIGRHVCELLAPGHEIYVLDSFEPIVHGEAADFEFERSIPDVAQVAKGRIEDSDIVCAMVDGCDTVIHLAAGVSVDRSFAEPSRFVRANSYGTSVLLEAIHKTATVKHLIVASSMSVYGEGNEYRGVIEDDPCKPASFYGASKYHQEQLCLLAKNLYGIKVTALRLWNTYGPGQSLTNAETGVIAIFASRILAGKPPLIFEDGEQLRDFVAVSDVAQAFKRALNSGIGGVFNIGSGHARSVLYAAKLLCAMLANNKVEPEITFTPRPGDIRHCWPNLSQARAILGWQPEVTPELGLAHYARWLKAL